MNHQSDLSVHACFLGPQNYLCSAQPVQARLRRLLLIFFPFLFFVSYEVALSNGTGGSPSPRHVVHHPLKFQDDFHNLIVEPQRHSSYRI